MPRNKYNLSISNVHQMVVDVCNILDSNAYINVKHMEKNSTFMDVRDSIKKFIDGYENNNNENFIGILEWAFCQELFENSHVSDDISALHNNIVERFSRHPNISVN